MTSLGSSQPLVSRQQVVLVLAPICESYAMAKEKKPDSGRVLSPGCRPQPHGHLRDGIHISPGCRFQKSTCPTKNRRRSYRVSYCRRFFSLTVHTNCTSTSHASDEISCAEQTDFLGEGLQAANARSSRFERLLPTRDAASANKPARERAPHGAREEKRRIRRRRFTIPAAVLTSGAYLCSLSASGSHTHSRKLRERIGQALSQRNRTHRVRHLADPDNRQLSTAWSWHLDPLF